MDASGVEKVLVNGVEAMLSEITPNSPEYAYLPAGASGDAVHWEVDLAVPFEGLDAVVSITDGQDNTDPNATEVTINYLPSAINDFALDSANQRLVTLDDEAVVIRDLATGEITYRPHLAIPHWGLHCWDTIEEDLYHWAVSNDRLSFFRSDWSTWPVVTEVIHHQEIDESFDIDWSDNFHCDTSNDRLILVGKSADNESRVYEFSLSTSSLKKVYPATDTEPGYSLDRSRLIGNALIAKDNTNHVFIEIDLNNGRTVGDPFHYPDYVLDIAKDSTRSEIYVVHFGGVDAINWITKGQTALVPAPTNGSAVFDQAYDSSLDKQAGRLLVADAGTVYSFNLETGDREIVLPHHVGTGPKIVWASDMVLNEDNSKVIILDGAGNMPARIIEVDLASGNRTQIANSFGPPGNPYNLSLLFDENSGLLYAIEGHEVFRIDIAENTSEAISSTGLGPVVSNPTDLVLDEMNNRLLVLSEGKLIAIDLATTDRQTILTWDDGAIPPWRMALTPDGKTIYASGTDSGDDGISSESAVYIVDVATNTRQTVTPDCLAGEVVRNISYDAVRDRLLIYTNENVVVFRETTGPCNSVYAGERQELLPISTDFLVTWDMHGLMLMDTKTSSSVIISN